MPPKIADIIEHDVCAACGACEAVCPIGAVTVKKAAEIRDPNNPELYRKGAAYEVCEGCLTCSRVCPVVDGFREDELANVRKFFAAKAAASAGSQDGGVTSAIVKTLFKKGEIDCAIGISRNEAWETELVIMTSAEDVENVRGTKYTSDPVLKILRQAFEKYNRIAVVGVPCQVHGARLIQENFNEKIVVIIGLLCMESFHHDVMLEKIIPEILQVKIKDIEKMEFTKGKFWVYTKAGEVHKVPIKEVARYARNPCHHCCDYTSVFADISVGSVGAPDGWNSVFIRTDAGEKYFEMVKEDLELMEDPKPGLELVQKLIGMKRKGNAEHYLEVCEKFSFKAAGIH
ncbi:MAG: F420H2 dehydrogenase subunit FpoF [Methanosarcinaceae archaeon]|nr:F420H2 dehydrogenase subunit FpoF [Methanosarcinaceae archaeon]MDD4749254.1 F420H2 dehydrogenase subunit FpoF [Methanosarcinaceae archaeon]